MLPLPYISGEVPIARRYTVKPERLPDEHLRVSLFRGVTGGPVPQRVDLRHKCPPVYDQGALGCSTSHALAAAVQIAKPTLQGSRLFLYYNERAAAARAGTSDAMIEGGGGGIQQDECATVAACFSALQKWGLCQEHEWPYVVDKFTTHPSSAAYTAALSNAFPHHAHVAPTPNEMMGCLATATPFVVGIMVYQSFESEQVARTGIVPMPAEGEQCLGGHTVLCVGYDAIHKAWIMRNSFGPGWGDHGYFYLPHAYLLCPANLASDVWRISK